MKMILTQNLKKLINNDDLTVAQLSRATKVPSQTINNWLSGLQPKNMNQVKAVANYFKLSLDELVYGETNQKVKKSCIDPISEHEDDINAGVFEVILRRVKK